MPKSFNVRFVAWLLLATFVLGIGVHFLHAFQVKRNASTLRTRAEQAQMENDSQVAAQYYERYLGLVPGDTEAMARFALLLADDRLATTRQTRQRACDVLEQVLRRDSERTDVRRRFVHLAMGLGRIADAKQDLTTLLKAAPEDGELMFLLAQCEEAEGQYSGAAARYQQVIDNSKDRAEKWVIKSQVRLASLFRQRLGKPAESDKVINDLAQRAPNDADVTLVVAEAAADKGDVEGARRRLERGASQFPKDSRMPIALAQLAARSGHRKEAIARLRQALAGESTNRTQILFVLADLLLDETELDEARGMVARLEQEQAAEPQVAYLRGRLLIAERNWPAACRLLESARPAPATPEVIKKADLSLAQCYEQMGNVDQQLEACRRALQVDPLWLPARTMLAAALSSAGRLDEAVEQCRKVLPRLPALRLVVVRLLVLRNLGRPSAERRWDEAEQLLSDIEKASPGTAEAAVLQADILAAKGNLEGAGKLLEVARQQQPEEAQLWIALAVLAEQQKNLDRALRLLEEAERTIGDRVDLRLARAGILVRGRPDSLRDDLALLERNEGAFSEKDRLRLLRGLAEAYYRAGAGGEAGCLWGKIARQQPYDVQVRLALLELALEAGDSAAIQRLVGELRQIEGEAGTLWRYGEAARLALRASADKGNTGDRDTASKLLDEVRKQRPSWPWPVALAGMLAELGGDPDRALAAYVQAIGLGERHPRVIRRTAVLLHERRQYAEADELIRRLPDEARASADLARLAADAAYGRGDKRRGLELAKGVATRSTDYHDQIWLGHMLQGAGQSEDAEQAFHEAIKRGETAPAPWTTLILYLVATGRKDAAETVLKEAQEKVAAAERPLMLARCYEALGNRPLAEQSCAEALRANPDNDSVVRTVAAFYYQIGQRTKAIQCLRQLLAPTSKATDQARSSAQRNLAILLAGGGPGPEWEEAWSLIEPEKCAISRLPADRRALSVVLIANPSRKFEAIPHLEWLVVNAAIPDDLFLLAQLYEARREDGKARELMLRLLASCGDNPLYLAHHVRELLRHGELIEAEPWLSKLEKVAPHSWETCALKARLLRARQKPEAATALVMQYSRQKDANPGLAANLLDELGQFKAAEELHRKNLAQTDRPDIALALAQNLSRQQRTREALELCETAWGRCSPEVVAQASVAILRRGPAEATQIRQVGQRLEEALQKTPNVPALQVALGDFRDCQGRFADAQAAYRAAIGKDANNIAALNNLAWLLTLQGDRSEEAILLVNRAIALSGPAPALLDTRAAALLSLGRVSEAIGEMKQVVSLAPTAPHHMRLARAYFISKDRTAARQELQKARAVGLQLTDLHPLEQKAFRQFFDEIDRN